MKSCMFTSLESSWTGSDVSLSNHCFVNFYGQFTALFSGQIERCGEDEASAS